MNRAADVWFIRLPNARILRASSTRAVRHYLVSGKIPPTSYARRTPLDSWVALARIEAFADLIEAPPSAPPRAAALHAQPERGGHGDSWNTLDLQMLGVRGLVSELISALDSALMRHKLKIAGGAGVLAGLQLLAQHMLVIFATAAQWPAVELLWLRLLTGGSGLLLTTSIVTALLTRLTFIELSQLRPAHSNEAYQHLGRNALRLCLCYLLVLGGLALLFWLLEALFPLLQTLPAGMAALAEGLIGLVAVVQLLLQVALIPLLVCALLLAPLLIIEETTVPGALRQWVRLLRQHPNQVFLYESMAVAVAFVVSLPFVLPVEWAAANAPEEGMPALATQAVLWLLRGLAFTPALAYLIVANVFIYLHLRYEQPPLR